MGQTQKPVGNLGLLRRETGLGGGGRRVTVNGAFVHSLAHTLPGKADVYVESTRASEIQGSMKFHLVGTSWG